MAFVIVGIAILFIYNKTRVAHTPHGQPEGKTDVIEANKIVAPQIVSAIGVPLGVEFEFYGNQSDYKVLVGGQIIEPSTDGSTVFSFSKKVDNLYLGKLSSSGVITFQVGQDGNWSNAVTVNSAETVSTDDTRLSEQITVLKNLVPASMYLISAWDNYKYIGRDTARAFGSTNPEYDYSYIMSMKECQNENNMIPLWEAGGFIGHVFYFEPYEPSLNQYRIYVNSKATDGTVKKMYLAMHHDTEINNNALDEMRVYACVDAPITYNGLHLLTKYDNELANDVWVVLGNRDGVVLKNNKYGLYVRCQATTNKGYLTAPFVIVERNEYGYPVKYTQILPGTTINVNELSIDKTFLFMYNVPISDVHCV